MFSRHCASESPRPQRLSRVQTGSYSYYNRRSREAEAMTDIFEFWAQVGPSDRIHPADRDVLSRVAHGFNTKCLPGCYWGRLRTAAVVLLFLSPGLSKRDESNAKLKRFQQREMRTRQGHEPFHADGSGFKWLASRTKCFGLNWEQTCLHMAVLNIGAYHSANFSDPPLLAALPSSRTSIAWAQEVLFPQAMAGERVVICLRAAAFWGLTAGRRYGQSLFAPAVTRGGHMKRGSMRDQIVAEVRSVVGLSA